MAEKKERGQRANEEARQELPPGVKLLRTLEGHQDVVKSVTFDPQGETLASGSYDKTVTIWEARNGKLLRTLEGHQAWGRSVAFDPQGGTLASASTDKTVKLWEARNGKLLRTLEGHQDAVNCVAFDPQGETLASGSDDKTVKIWEARSGKLLRTLEDHQGWVRSVAFDPQSGALASASDDETVKVWESASGRLLATLNGHMSAVVSVAFDPQGLTLASGSFDETIKLWEPTSGRLRRTLEGHTAGLYVVAFSEDGRLLASWGADGLIWIWSGESGETVAVIPEPASNGEYTPALAFHPTAHWMATAGSMPGQKAPHRHTLIRIWELDLEMLLGQRAGVAAAARAVHHTTGKIVLVGDHSVGKSALGYRLIHGRFEKQESTHGQQFWVFPDLGKRRADGTDCEAILWDFAGQPDYRLVHALFVDNADLALVLFDASDLRDPLHGVGFWLKQLQTGQSHCPILLVAAQTDRGSCSLTPEELKAFCQKHGIVGPIETSAATGLGLAELVERMKSLIPWEDKPATVTTTTFKRIKDYVLGLKGAESDTQIMVTSEELRGRL